MAFLLLILPVPKARAQVVGAVVAGVTVSAIVDKLKTAIDDVIRQLDQSVSSNSFQIRQHLEILESELEHSTLTIQDRVFENIDEQQQQLLVNAESIIADARSAIKGTIAQVDEVSTKITTEIDRLPLIDKSPRITKLSPIYIIDPHVDSEVIVSASGSFLNYGPPIMRVGTFECAAVGQTDVSISFRCPGVAFARGEGIRANSGSIVVRDREDFWSKLKDVFRYYVPQKNYQALIFSVPPRMGTFKVTTTVKATKQTFADRSGQISASNGHCEHDRRHGPFNFSVLGGPGWTIVPDSITLGGETSGNGGRSVEGPNDVTPTGFQYWIHLDNTGGCGPARAWVDARAWMTRAVAWREVKLTDEDVAVELVPSSPLIWGRDEAISLPDRWQSIRIEVDFIDGRHEVMTGPDRTRAWLQVETDVGRRTLLIRPRAASEALASS